MQLKYAMAHLPPQADGFGVYGLDEVLKYEDDNNCKTKSVSVQSLAAQQAQVVSDHMLSTLTSMAHLQTPKRLTRNPQSLL